MSDDVELNDRRAAYTATAAQTVFDIDFPIEEAADIAVYQNGDLIATYTVDLDASTITLNTGAAAGDSIVIEGNTQPVRKTAYPLKGDLRASLLNLDIRRLLRIAQEVVTKVSRRVSLAQNEDAAVPATLPKRVAGRPLIWGAAAADGLVNSDLDLGTLEVDLAGVSAAADAAAASALAADASADAAAASAASITLPIPVASGGTGQTGKTTGFNALSPLTTKGDIIVHNGTNSVRLAVGTNGKALVADSTAPEGVKWGDSGALVPLVSATASASATLDFTTNINSTYDTYVFEFENVLTSAAAQVYARTSSNGGSSYDSGGTDYRDSSGALSADHMLLGGGGAQVTRFYGNYYMYSPSGSQNKDFYSELKYRYTAGATQTVSKADMGGSRDSASAVNAIRFYPSTGTFTSGAIRMYGVKKS